MTPKEIKERSAKLAALYTAKANGKTLQRGNDKDGWFDTPVDFGPDMMSDLSMWRVKPEPQTMWTFESRTGATGRTKDGRLVADWKAAGYTVTEWQEVLP